MSDVIITCFVCGSDLFVRDSYTTMWEDIKVIVDPCETCLKQKEDDTREHTLGQAKLQDYDYFGS